MAVIDLNPVYSTCRHCGKKIYRYTNEKAHSTTRWFHDNSSNSKCGNGMEATPVTFNDYLKQVEL